MKNCYDCPCLGENEEGTWCKLDYDTDYKKFPDGKWYQYSMNCKLVSIITEDKVILASTFDMTNE